MTAVIKTHLGLLGKQRFLASVPKVDTDAKSESVTIDESAGSSIVLCEVDHLVAANGDFAQRIGESVTVTSNCPALPASFETVVPLGRLKESPTEVGQSTS